MFFQPAGPSPRLIGPIGGDFGGYMNTPLDPKLQLQGDLRVPIRDREWHRHVGFLKGPRKIRIGKNPKSVRPLPGHQETIPVEPLKVGDGHGKPASPRGLERRNAFDALEYSSPRYLLEEENHSPRKLPGPHTRREQFKVANEAFESLEDTFMVPLEPTSAN